jgi:hypothetical protein
MSLLLLSGLDVWYQKRHFVVVDPHFLLALGPERPLQPVEPHERIPERTPSFLDFGLWKRRTKRKQISYDLHNSVYNAILLMRDRSCNGGQLKRSKGLAAYRIAS